MPARLLWQRGQTPNALLPDYANSGGRGKERAASEGVKRGRPRKAGGDPGLNADLALRRVFRAATALYAAEHANFSRRGGYRAMLRAFFDGRRVDLDSGRVLPAAAPSTVLPSFGQFNYWLARDSWADGLEYVNASRASTTDDCGGSNAGRDHDGATTPAPAPSSSAGSSARQRGQWQVRLACDPSDLELVYLLDAAAPMQFHACHPLLGDAAPIHRCSPLAERKHHRRRRGRCAFPTVPYFPRHWHFPRLPLQFPFRPSTACKNPAQRSDGVHIPFHFSVLASPWCGVSIAATRWQKKFVAGGADHVGLILIDAIDAQECRLCSPIGC